MTRNHGKGTKAQPGWFYGFSADVWQAAALAVYAADKIEAAVAAYANHINRENRERRIAADADRRGLARIDKAAPKILQGKGPNDW